MTSVHSAVWLRNIGRGKTPNAECTCLLAVSFTCVCLLLALLVGQDSILLFLALSNKSKLTASKHKLGQIKSQPLALGALETIDQS